MAMTNHKAWGGAVGALVAMLAARGVVYALPFVTPADYPIVYEVASLIVGAGLGYAATWWAPANRTRG